MSEKFGVHAKIQESKQQCSNFCSQKPSYNSSVSPADRILQLQRTAGNQAIQRLIKSRVLQAKLRVGQPNDIYEQEADRVAEQVMRMPDPVLQRKCAKCDKDEKNVLQAKESLGQLSVTHGQGVPPVVHEVLRSPGQPLDLTTRAFMEPRFGYDFSRVRVHTDAKAAESAQSVNAMAYTVGQNIIFGSDNYIPRTENGKRILAHELTHVVQQSKLTTEIKPGFGREVIPTIHTGIYSIVQRDECKGRNGYNCNGVRCTASNGRRGTCHWGGVKYGCVCRYTGGDEPGPYGLQMLPSWLTVMLSAAALAAIAACFASGACEMASLIALVGVGLAKLIANIFRDNGVIITGEDTTASLESTGYSEEAS